MGRAPHLIAATLFVAAGATAVHLAPGAGPFDQGSGLVLGIGFLIYGAIALAGLLLSRGRWSRWLGAALALATLAASALTAPWTPAAVVAVVASSLAIFGLSGRWLDGWIRRRPSAEGPGPAVMALVLGLIGLVPLVALATPTEITPWHGILGAAGIFLGWSYARAQVWALWALRFGLPIISIPAILRSPLAGAVIIAAGVVALTVLAWSKVALLAVQPLMDHLPGPRVLGERKP